MQLLINHHRAAVKHCLGALARLEIALRDEPHVRAREKRARIVYLQEQAKKHEELALLAVKSRNQIRRLEKKIAANGWEA